MTEHAEREDDQSSSPEAPDAPTEEARVDEPPAAPDSDANPSAVIAELEAKAAETWDKYVRAAAEVDNVRKRASRDVENARRFALERFAKELLAVLDSLEMGLGTDADVSAAALREGSEATLKLFVSTLTQFGVVEIDPLGEPFDPEQHEAMAMQPVADAEPGSVVAVYQKGYALNGRLLRAARVVVAQEPPASTE